jgi:hypothetical protein
VTLLFHTSNLGSEPSGKWFNGCDEAEKVLTWTKCECLEAQNAVDECNSGGDTPIPPTSNPGSEPSGKWFNGCDEAKKVLKWKKCVQNPSRVQCLEAQNAVDECNSG